MEGSNKIKEIGISNNKLTAVSGNQIAKALTNDEQLKILDLSWNLIGVKPKDIKHPKKPGKIFKLMKKGEIGK